MCTVATASTSAVELEEVGEEGGGWQEGGSSLTSQGSGEVRGARVVSREERREGVVVVEEERLEARRGSRRDSSPRLSSTSGWVW